MVHLVHQTLKRLGDKGCKVNHGSFTFKGRWFTAMSDPLKALRHKA